MKILSNITYFFKPSLVKETFQKFSSLSKSHKILCVSLTILAGLVLILPGLIVFRVSTLKLNDLENSQIKKIAKKVHSVARKNTDLSEMTKPTEK